MIVSVDNVSEYGLNPGSLKLWQGKGVHRHECRHVIEVNTETREVTSLLASHFHQGMTGLPTVTMKPDYFEMYDTQRLRIMWTPDMSMALADFDTTPAVPEEA